MGTVLDRGVPSPRYPSTMPKSLRHPRDKVCWLDLFLLCLVPWRGFGSLRSLVQLPTDAKLSWLVSLDSRRQSCEVCPPSCLENICTTSSLHCLSLTSDILCSWRFDARAGGGHFSVCHFPPSGNERGGDFQIQKKFLTFVSGKEWNDAEWNGTKWDDDDASDSRSRSKHDSAKYSSSSATAR